jgi:hypothetical protein
VEGKITVERRRSAPIYSKAGEVMGQLDLTTAQWHGGEDLEAGAEAVEVAFVQHPDGETYVAVRRTPPMPPDDHVIVYSELEWELFSRRAAEGYFDPDQVAARREQGTLPPET